MVKMYIFLIECGNLKVSGLRFCIFFSAGRPVSVSLSKYRKNTDTEKIQDCEGLDPGLYSVFFLKQYLF